MHIVFIFLEVDFVAGDFFSFFLLRIGKRECFLSDSEDFVLFVSVKRVQLGCLCPLPHSVLVIQRIASN